MTLRDLEDALDRLENELCGRPIDPHILREIEIFTQKALAAAAGKDPLWRCDFLRFVRQSFN